MRNATETSFDGANVRISVKDDRLAARISRGVRRSVEKAREELTSDPRDVRVVRFRTSARLAALEPAGFTGALVVIRVTSANLRRLSGFIDRAKAGGAYGVQLVWDGKQPLRDAAEPYIFRELERARALPREAPVVVAESARPASGLVFMARHRARLRNQVSV
jgi:hypothetical protein